MSNEKPTVRIDWFDGTVVEAPSQSSIQSITSEFADEEPADLPKTCQPKQIDKKIIGFKKLLDLSFLNPQLLTLELSSKSGFWNLLNSELKGDFIVLIVQILAKLYRYLEQEETSLLKSLLRTKFEKSNFLKTLADYLKALPKVRIVEKRMNSHLWDDVESFYCNVLALCKGMLSTRIDNLSSISEFLEVIITSITGVQEEHSERFSDDLFIKMEELQIQICEEKTNGDKISANLKNCVERDSYKNLPIFPSKDDLFNKNNIRIQPNIINGAYPSIEHYLDLQFKLLREDCFGPLRDGICKYKDNPTKRKHENIRVHPKVRIIRTYVTSNKVGHLVDIAWKKRTGALEVDCKKFAINKQLMFGSLLLFTCDNFETMLCATVLDSNINLLREGYIVVSFQTPVSNKIFSEAYLMVESEVFFEPYHRVLKVIQNSRKDDLPMRRYIVDVKPDTKPPDYLTPETMYAIQEVRDNTEISFSVLDLDKYPSNSIFNLDDSQMEAFKFALTREFAVIQGPPGTGKTFLGIKIASTLLKNLSLEGTPMLIICYTNHALDQFLEGILKVTNNIVRLGSQSKNKSLEPYTLNNMRTRTKSKYSFLYSSKRAELETIYKQMTEIQNEIEKCEREILCYKCIKPHLKIDSKVYELQSSIEDPVLKWLFHDVEDSEESEENELEDWEKQVSDLNTDDDKLETCFSEQWALKEIDSMLKSIKYVKDVAHNEIECEKMTNKFEDNISKTRKRLLVFKKQLSCIQNTETSKSTISKVSDLNRLKPEQRWQLYWSTVEDIKKMLISKMNVLLEQHTTCSQELNEVATLIDGEVMKAARVIGVTTTTAARRHDLMRKLLSPIVIVEEAAEVLEAHIVASLTHHCQHLILIGDHKQLRPTAAHYKLAKDYNLEISLFERMIRNGVHARTLTTQRRMRPDVVDLLVPAVYERLVSHPTVLAYADVRGLKDNLYFYMHDVLEDLEGLEDSWSHKNKWEAQWCIALANYLRVMEYKAEEITVLATYTGQVTLIKELSKKYSLLKDVKITVVDNYQGEENRIVIISLVRSNRDGKIGFLSAINRICVALSRAKEGFYMFGNMSMLRSASGVWRAIDDTLNRKNAIGRRFTLQCNTHKDNILEILNPEDFDNCLVGTCLNTCKK